MSATTLSYYFCTKKDGNGEIMYIHHAMMVRNQPANVYEALIRSRELEIWMDGKTSVTPEVGAIVDIQYDGGQRTLKMEILDLEVNKQVKWRVIQPIWPSDNDHQVITWTLSAYEASTLVDFRMEGWEQDDDIFASVSYKWASFMMRLKIHLGDVREIVSLLPIEIAR